MNDLTKLLLSAGYIPAEHKTKYEPETYKVVYSEFNYSDSWRCFEYSQAFLRKMVFESPCGLLKSGIHIYNHMGYMGIKWCPENDNPVFRCPYDKEYCKMNHEHLKKAYGKWLVQCAFKFSNKAYNYERSYEKVWDDKEYMKEEKRKAFYAQLKWNPKARHCECIKWSEKKQDWQAEYNPWNCAQGCHNDICVLKGVDLSGKKGNVFYDVRRTKTVRDGSLFNGSKDVSVLKGKRVFESPKPLPICEAYAEHCKECIEYRENINRRLGENDVLIEVINVRAEFRESRDLLQDLQDAREGIKIAHASDLIKAKKQAKRQRKVDKKMSRERGRVRRIKKIYHEGVMPDGTQASDDMQRFAELEIKGMGLSVAKVPEQLSLFGP